MYEPLGGVYIGSGDETQRKPALFVMSCGEGHLDLRTADKVLETLQAKEAGEAGLPSAVAHTTAADGDIHIFDDEINEGTQEFVVVLEVN